MALWLAVLQIEGSEDAAAAHKPTRVQSGLSKAVWNDDVAGALQARVNAAIKPFRTPPSFARSLCYLGRDILYIACVAWLTQRADAAAWWWLPPAVLAPIYAVVMGTVATGLWVLAHECGHGAFGSSRWQNDAVGFVLHSLLFVPYWSWQYSHAKHHKFTNHITLGETWVPSTVPHPNPWKLKHKKKKKSRVAGLFEDVAPVIDMLVTLLVGWPIYLVTNTAGGRTQTDRATPKDARKWADHFHSGSQVMPNTWKIEASTAGCLCTAAGLAVAAWQHGARAVAFWYVGPLLVVNCWLVGYTYLHHTHEDVPHFGADKFTWLRGALATVDRPYPWVVDHLHHHIGSTHVAHHLCSAVPHYRARAMTEALRPVLGNLYNYDPRPVHVALFATPATCHGVVGLRGVQHYVKGGTWWS